MTTPDSPNFRALAQELVDAYACCIKKYIHSIPEKDTLVLRARAALATTPPEPPTSQIAFNAPSPPEEVIRLDKEGFHYKGQFVADAGEAHRLMMAFLEQNTKTKPEPPTDEEIQEWADARLGAGQGDPETFGWGWRCFKGEAFALTIRAALERWGR